MHSFLKKPKEIYNKVYDSPKEKIQFLLQELIYQVISFEKQDNPDVLTSITKDFENK